MAFGYGSMWTQARKKSPTQVGVQAKCWYSINWNLGPNWNKSCLESKILNKLSRLRAKIKNIFTFWGSRNLLLRCWAKWKVAQIYMQIYKQFHKIILFIPNIYAKKIIYTIWKGRALLFCGVLLNFYLIKK